MSAVGSAIRNTRMPERYSDYRLEVRDRHVQCARLESDRLPCTSGGCHRLSARNDGRSMRNQPMHKPPTMLRTFAIDRPPDARVDGTTIARNTADRTTSATTRDLC